MLPRGLALALVLILVAHHSLLVSGAYAVVCCDSSQIDYQVTKDCCPAVANGQKGWKAAQQHFDERYHNCISNNLAAGNSDNEGDVARHAAVLAGLQFGGPLMQMHPRLVADCIMYYPVFNPRSFLATSLFFLCALS